MIIMPDKVISHTCINSMCSKMKDLTFAARRNISFVSARKIKDKISKT
jgi:hypothetical protein